MMTHNDNSGNDFDDFHLTWKESGKKAQSKIIEISDSLIDLENALYNIEACKSLLFSYWTENLNSEEMLLRIGFFISQFQEFFPFDVDELRNDCELISQFLRYSSKELNALKSKKADANSDDVAD